MRSSWQTTDSASHFKRAISSAAWQARLRLPVAYDDPTYVNDTIRREHSPPRRD
ncbi:MAG TPA: hypothetical protein VKQ30_20310 [Ktedonobacterales bacterium]|nr:hypothetical protein [Ktedonobacterales bacterium]